MGLLTDFLYLLRQQRLQFCRLHRRRLDLLVQVFTRTADDTIFGTFVRPDCGARNFIYFRGDRPRFGKLTMADTDLLIHDGDEHDPLDLYLARYNRQLVAGHTKNLANYGLRTWMVDYGKLGNSPTLTSLGGTAPP